MPMSKIVPPNAVGYYALIHPTVFWNGSFIERDYTEWAERVIHGRVGATPEQLEQIAVEFIVHGAQAAIDPDIRALPLDHPTRQEALKKHKIGLSVFAYLRSTRFFVLVYDGDQCRYEKLRAKTITQAQKLILNRPDVQAIERILAVSWEPTSIH